MDIKKDVILNVYKFYFGSVLKEIQNADVMDNIKERKKELIKTLTPVSTRLWVLQSCSETTMFNDTHTQWESHFM